MMSSEGFQYHFCIISKFIFCDCYMKKNVAFTLISMRWLFISSSAIWVTGLDTRSVASRARTELTRSKREWTRIWTTYLEFRGNNPTCFYILIRKSSFGQKTIDIKFPPHKPPVKACSKQDVLVLAYAILIPTK